MQEVEGKLREDKIKHLAIERYWMLNVWTSRVISLKHFSKPFDYWIFWSRTKIEGEVLKCRSLSSTVLRVSEKLNASKVNLASIDNLLEGMFSVINKVMLKIMANVQLLKLDIYPTPLMCCSRRQQIARASWSALRGKSQTAGEVLTVW